MEIGVTLLIIYNLSCEFRMNVLSYDDWRGYQSVQLWYSQVVKKPMGKEVLNIPDLRVEQTFKRAVAKETKEYIIKNKATFPRSTITELTRVEKAVICSKVILRDILVMPFLQSVAWTGFLIVLKPWLRTTVTFGRKMGSSAMDLITGRNLVKSKPKSIWYKVIKIYEIS